MDVALPSFVFFSNEQFKGGVALHAKLAGLNNAVPASYAGGPAVWCHHPHWLLARELWRVRGGQPNKISLDVKLAKAMQLTLQFWQFLTCSEVQSTALNVPKPGCALQYVVCRDKPNTLSQLLRRLSHVFCAGITPWLIAAAAAAAAAIVLG